MSMPMLWVLEGREEEVDGEASPSATQNVYGCLKKAMETKIRRQKHFHDKGQWELAVYCQKRQREESLAHPRICDAQLKEAISRLRGEFQ